MTRRFSAWLIVLLAASGGTGTYCYATENFTHTTNTGNNAVVIIPTNTVPSVAGIPLQEGDEIGVFRPTGDCVGGALWTGKNIAVTVWGDNSVTEVEDGILQGEQMVFKVYQSSSGHLFEDILVTVEAGDLNYEVNGIYIVTSLASSSGISGPEIFLPDDGEELYPNNVTLNWGTIDGAQYYEFQLSKEPDFASIEKEETGLEASTIHFADLAVATTYYWRARAVVDGNQGDWSQTATFTTSATVSTGREIPDRTELHQNYPNPFNPSTNFNFSLSRPEHVTIHIYSPLGQRVATIVSHSFDAGRHEVRWDASRLASGMYVFRMVAGDHNEIRTMTLLR